MANAAPMVRVPVVKEEDMKTHVARRYWMPALVLLAVSAITSMTSAAPPWKKLVPFKSVEADPNKSYWLTEDQGPWLIFATSFAGPGAEEDAHRLVLELRKRFKMEAYMHKRHYDFSQPVVGRGVNRYGGPKLMRYRNSASFDEIAVLVGNYASHDAPGADEDLETIRTAKPECLAGAGGDQKKTTQRFAALRELQRLVNLDPEIQKAGPMRRSFVARNPLLPKEFFTGSGLDPFVLNMNRGVEHSLLDCPGKYTVRVASFRGVSQFVGENKNAQQRDRGGLLPGTGQTSQLEIAADNAHRLTEILRQRGVEAFEFHDRFESIVTIGSFESVGNTLPDGRIDLHPQIYQIMQQYGAQRNPLPGQAQGLRPRTLDGISFDVQPLPVEVPRRSLASDYAADTAGLQ